MRAIARKLSVDSSVSFTSLAHETEGFTGADLQALLYNAHLEVIHEILENSKDSSKTSHQSSLNEDFSRINYEFIDLSIDQNSKKMAMSLAEQTAESKRVSNSSTLLLCYFIPLVLAKCYMLWKFA